MHAISKLILLALMITTPMIGMWNTVKKYAQENSIGILVGASIASYTGYKVWNYYWQQELLNEQFLEAVKNNDLKKVQECIAQGVLINPKNIDNGNTAFELALYYRNIDIAKYLIDKGAHLNPEDNTEWKALYFIMRTNSTTTAQYLIDKRTNLDLQDKYGFTILHYAADYGRTEIARYLVKRGANATIRSRNNLTAYNIAAAFRMLQHKEPIADFLFLIENYETARYTKILIDNEVRNKYDSNKLHTFLQQHISQRSDILEVALSKNRFSDLELLNTINPVTYTWSYMLALAAENNLYVPVSALMAKLTTDHKGRQDIQEIRNYAQAHNKKRFIKAILDFERSMCMLRHHDKLCHDVIPLIMSFNG